MCGCCNAMKTANSSIKLFYELLGSIDVVIDQPSKLTQQNVSQFVCELDAINRHPYILSAMAIFIFFHQFFSFLSVTSSRMLRRKALALRKALA